MTQVVVKEGEPIITRIDDDGAGTVYIGRALLGTTTNAALWQIQKIVTAATITSMSWAGGDAEYEYVWDSRTTYSYS